MTRFRERRFVGVARVLAGVLALALLLLELLSADGAFHEALHHSGKTTASTCVLCLFAKGQIASADPAPVFTASFQPIFGPPALKEITVLVDFHYLAFPSRAPPASLSPLSVVA